MSVHFSNLYGIFKNSSYHVSKEKTSAQRQKRKKPLLDFIEANQPKLRVVKSEAVFQPQNELVASAFPRRINNRKKWASASPIFCANLIQAVT